MDALSDLLRVVRLTGGVFLEAEFSAPWSITSQVGPEDCRFVLAEPARLISFHYVISGKLLLQIDRDPAGGSTRRLHCAVAAERCSYAREPARIEAVDSERLIQMDPEAGLARIQYGGGGEVTRIVCGVVGSESDCNPLIDALPSTLVLDLNGKACGRMDL